MDQAQAQTPEFTDAARALGVELRGLRDDFNARSDRNMAAMRKIMEAKGIEFDESGYPTGVKSA